MKNKKLLAIIFILTTMLAIVGCSSELEEAVNQDGSSLELAIDTTEVVESITDEFSVDTIEVIIEDTEDESNRYSQKENVDSTSVNFSFADLKAATYEIEVIAEDENEYPVYSAKKTKTVSGTTTASIDLEVLEAEKLVVNFDNIVTLLADLESGIPEDDIAEHVSGEVILHCINDNLTAAIDWAEMRAEFDSIPADTYDLTVDITINHLRDDGTDPDLIEKSGQLDVLPGRETFTEDINLAAEQDYLGEIEFSWERIIREARVWANPSGGEFYETEAITLRVSGDEITASKYSLDGTDPKEDGIAYQDGDEITIGQDMEIGDSLTLKLWAENKAGEDSSQYSFTKIEEDDLPEPKEHPLQLGAVYEREQTSFRIWSPETDDVQVIVDGQEYQAERIPDFDGYTEIYEAVVEGDLHLSEYQFVIAGVEVRDPYGVMIEYDPADMNPDNPQGENYEEAYSEDDAAEITSNVGSNTNIVMDLSRTDLENKSPRPDLAERVDTILYETHIGDFTGCETSGVPEEKRGTYKGMVKSGTSYGGHSTGIDYLTELGITHVHLMPFYDFANKYNHQAETYYNWGYDPVNFNVPEDRYSLVPDDYEYRIWEVKEMVNQFHQNDLRTIMDVTYNHTFWDEQFEDITERYFTGDNDSGTGNGIDTSDPMVSRFIQDSLEFWVREYGIDGFRFDLMGIFHYDVVRDWGEHLNNEFPDRDLVLYGEPWNGYFEDPDEEQKVRLGTTPAIASGHVGVFNSVFREAIKGGGDDDTRGYMFNEVPEWEGQIEAGLRGAIMAEQSRNPLDDMWDSMFAYDPEQSINYVGAHDNFILWDKIDFSGIDDDVYAQRIVRFAHGILLTSQGIPFLHSGDEMFRTKQRGPHSDDYYIYRNSYMWGEDMNNFQWDLLAENQDSVQYHQDLIEIRRNHPGFRLSSWDEINNYVHTEVSNGGQTNTKLINAGAVGDEWEQIFVVVHSGNNIDINLPDGTWTEVFNSSGRVENEGLSGTVEIEGTAITIFAQY